MPFIVKFARLNRQTLLFPLALVLFEFAVYIGNDMAQPAMLFATREFGVSMSWVPISMTAYLVGGASLSWFTGPLSDRVGRRPVLLGGVLFFLLSCLATYFVFSIEAFIALRVLQGLGLCFIGSVGYAVVQETFDEINAVKVTALMANVALIAPMVGPLAGAALAGMAPWRTCFLVIAAISLVSLIGLWKKMPETVNPDTGKPPYSQIIHDYIALFSQARFVHSSLSMALISMALIGWIAMSPVLLVNDFGLTLFDYGLWQLPVFLSLVAGNVVVFFIADRWPLGHSILIGFWPMLMGMVVAFTGLFVHLRSPLFLVTGISLMAFAEGLSISVLYRFALMSSEKAKGIVSAGMSMLAMVCYALGIEITRVAYVAWGLNGFTLSVIALGCCYILITRPRIHAEMTLRSSTEFSTAPD